ncbi:MAG TPA: HD domain-containing protein [Gemmatimonadaceae bacterium]|nr:HD domain-containing protein [Gemmatimonadaceae bacterium]
MQQFDFTTIRDPLWNNIRLEPLATRLMDTGVVQRLRYVRQLGLAFLVYPGATHSRFEHALGTYHLSRRSLAILQEHEPVPADAAAIARMAALLHDVGHYPFSHALEEIGAPHHENVARDLVMQGEVAEILGAELGPQAPARVVALIQGKSRESLQGLIAGSLDLDKIEYLKRDALMCGVPYGEIDVDRLLHSLVVVDGQIGVLEKGLAALESLLFAKYQMYRNVYWHHAVRSATAMYKRLVEDALRSETLDFKTLTRLTDEALLTVLPDTSLLRALRSRKLYKRAMECPAADFDEGAADWIASDRALVVETEDELARRVGLEPGELLIDFPAKTQMLDLNIAVLRKNGEVERLTGRTSAINLPALSTQLYRSARWLRVFTARPVTLPEDEVRRWLERR